jgi:hypothetical protein
LILRRRHADCSLARAGLVAKREVAALPSPTSKRLAQRTTHFMIRFKLKHLVAFTTLVATYFGVLAGAVRLIGVSSNLAFSVWSQELLHWPVYIVWMVTAVVVFERRNECILAAKLTLLSLLGFGVLYLLNAIARIWFMAAIQANGSVGAASTYWFVWNVFFALLNFVCWILLLVALVKAMGRTKSTEHQLAGD